jgi:hypothetical protein
MNPHHARTTESPLKRFARFFTACFPRREPQQQHTVLHDNESSELTDLKRQENMDEDDLDWAARESVDLGEYA